MTDFEPEPSCPYSERCPGCPAIDLPYAAQLRDKRARVVAALAPYRALAGTPVGETLPAQPRFAYRTRAKLVAHPSEGLGLYARGGHTLVDLPDCGVLLPELATLVHALRAWVIAGAPIAAVDVASVGTARLVTLIVEGGERALAAARQHVAPLLDKLPADVHVAISVRKAGPQLLGAQHTLVRGQAEVRARNRDEGPYHYATHGAFSQAHRAVAQAIYAQIRARIEQLPGARPLRVLELFAGSGALSLSLAAAGCEVTAVEAFAPAVARIDRAAREQRLPVRAIAGDAARVTTALSQAGEHFDAVLVNPPRRGLEPALREAVRVLRPRVLSYVSCSPETLARDLASFARAGLVAEGVWPCDMIPLSDHVESLVFLRVGESEPLTVVRAAAHFDVLRCADAADVARARVRATTALAFAPPVGASGLALVTRGPGDVQVRDARMRVLARGITHKRGRLGALTYRCEARVGGHSLLSVEGPAAALASVFAELARVRHPVIGDARRDGASARHFAMRHGLERPFADCVALAIEDEEVEVELAPDLASVLQSLRNDRARTAFE